MDFSFLSKDEVQELLLLLLLFCVYEINFFSTSSLVLTRFTISKFDIGLLRWSILTCCLLLLLWMLGSCQNFIIDEIINEFDCTKVEMYTDCLCCMVATWCLLILNQLWVQSIFDWNELKMFHKPAPHFEWWERKNECIFVTKQHFLRSYQHHTME